ncbi:MAG: hypothetical protein QM767_24195 [Anaeromyxobacter sp.]
MDPTVTPPSPTSRFSLSTTAAAPAARSTGRASASQHRRSQPASAAASARDTGHPAAQSERKSGTSVAPLALVARAPTATRNPLARRSSAWEAPWQAVE